MRILPAIAAILTVLTITVPVATYQVGEATNVPWPPVACGNPCVIEDDGGGIIDTYAAEGRLLAAEHIPVIVDGPCMSACTVLVDMARNDVCVTTRALLGYHQ